MKLANSEFEKVTPHIKHFATKYHWVLEKFPQHQIVSNTLIQKFRKQICSLKRIGITRSHDQESVDYGLVVGLGGRELTNSA